MINKAIKVENNNLKEIVEHFEKLGVSNKWRCGILPCKHCGYNPYAKRVKYIIISLMGDVICTNKKYIKENKIEIIL